MTLTWRTASEADVFGFIVWRVSPTGARSKVNRKLVLAKAAGRPAGASYRFVDARVRPGRYTYRLQAVTGGGARVWLAATAVRAR